MNGFPAAYGARIPVSIDWFKLTNFLGLSPLKRTLPITLQCPLCQGHQLTIFPDHHGFGQWHYCSNCQSYGDLLQLAEAKLQLSTEALFSKLLQEGIARLSLRHTDTNSAAKAYKPVRKLLQRVNTLIDGSAEFLPKSRSLITLLNKLHINPHVPAASYKLGFGRVIGGAETMDIQAVFAPRNVKLTDRGSKRRTCHTNGQIFRVGYWGDALMVPYYTAPNRPILLQFIGRECRPDMDMPIKDVKVTPNSPVIGGLAFHPDLLRKKPTTVLAIENLIVYLRMQASHYGRSETKPLPVVHWYADEKRTTRDAWQLFATSNKVFWCVDITPEVLEQAYNTDGQITVTNIDNKSETGIREFMQSKLPSRLVLELVKQAKPWPEALEAWSERAGNAATENLFRLIALRKLNPEFILRKCSAAFRRRIKALLAPSQTQREMLFDKYTIIDSEEGWFALQYLPGGDNLQTPALISDVRLQIEDALYCDTEADVIYSGKLLYKKHELPFKVAKRLLEKDVFGWIQRQIVKAKLGVSLYNAAWTSRFVSLALHLHPPRLGKQLTRVGWDAERNRLELAQYALTDRGVAVLHNKTLIADNFPAKKLPEPAELLISDIEPLLVSTPANGAFWATFALVAGSVVGDMLGYNPQTAVVKGEDLDMTFVREIVTKLGCTEFKLAPNTATPCWPHSWPLCVSLANNPSRNQLVEWLTRLDNPVACIVRCNHWQWHTLCADGWLGVSIPALGVRNEPLPECTPALLPTYLADFLKRGGNLNSKEKLHITRILDDISHWIKTLYGTPTVITAACKHFQLDTADSATELVCSMLPEGFATIVAGKVADDTALYRTAHGLFLPSSLLGRFIDKKTGIDVNLSNVLQNLTGYTLAGKPQKYGGVYLDEVKLAKQLKRVLNTDGRSHALGKLSQK